MLIHLRHVRQPGSSTYAWTAATPGEHTVTSRVTDVNGQLQPTAEDLEVEKTFLEDNSQQQRKVMIS
ncbi:MAG: hypothetical protein O2968_18870 [Acidobacteria bacterium]|nr:hypothetical protein [Acidobacteriota bacterium]